MTDTCQRFDEMIARSARLTTEQTAELAAHLTGCSACRELARALQPVDSDAALAATGFTKTVPDSPRANAAAGHDRQLAEVPTGRYRITGEVGRGGIGRVLQALDQVLDRPVAVKELFTVNDGARRRFIREALITARLQHPSIVPVYDAGTTGDQSPFYAMKLVAGRPLDQSIADATTLAQRLALLPSVLAVADAVAYAHSERIIHRDLKPTNVLVGKYGETVVIDWGLAKDLAIDDRDALDAGPYRATGLDQTVAGAVLGTPAYMAPEQAAGEPVDERADVYALGAILYQVVSGAIPHEGTTLEEMVRRVVSGEVRQLTEREPEAPRDLAAIVNKAMALDPSRRYPDAQGVADDLRRFLNGQLVASHSYGARELVWRFVRRHRAAVTVALAGLVVVAVGGIASVMRIVRAKHQADDAAAVASKERSIAEHEKTSATEMLADLLTEQGRQELLAGRPARAAVYLSQAQAQSHDPGVALRSLLADAMRSIEAQRISLGGHPDDVYVAAFSPDGTRIVTAGDRTAQIWDPATGRLVTTLKGHEDDIESASFSPDGSRIVTASTDKTARLWDPQTGRVLLTLVHPDVVISAEFSPDGARIVTTAAQTGPAGLIARLWDARSGQLLAAFKDPQFRMFPTAFSPDGSQIVTASRDETATVRDVKTAKVLRSLKGHGADVSSAAFSPDGSQIVTASYDHTARLWDSRTGKLLTSLEGHTGAVIFAAYSSDSASVVTASKDNTARLWDAVTGKLLTSFIGHTAEVHSAAFSPDGSRVVTASHDHTAKLWDVRTGRLLATFEGHRDDVTSASFSPDGTQILTASNDGTAKLWDARPSQLRVPLDGVTGDIRSGRFSHDGARFLTTAEHDRTARLWDVRSGKLLASLDGHRGAIVSALFDPSDAHVVTASADGTAKLWDANTGKLLVSVDHTGVSSAALSPDGSRVVTLGFRRAGARIWNAKTGELIAKLHGHSDDGFQADHSDDVAAARFSMDGSRVVIATGDGMVRIWRTDNGNLVAEITELGPAYSVAFSQDGERLVTGGVRHARLWDARTGKLVNTLEGHTGRIYSALFSHDGTRVVTASDDHTAKLWDARTGKLLASFDGHTDVVLHAAFSPDPDSARVVTASRDHTAKLWDVRTGKLLASLDGHTGGLLDAAFSPDGTRVMTASRDGTIWISDVHLEDRKPDAIRRVLSAGDPWTFSNGGLVPVRVLTSSDEADSDADLADRNGETPERGSAAPSSTDEYITKLIALTDPQIDLDKEPDCDKRAANIRAFADANKAQIAALVAWRKTHTVDYAAVDRALAPKMRGFRKSMAAFQKCEGNKAFVAANDALSALFK